MFFSYQTVNLLDKLKISCVLVFFEILSASKNLAKAMLDSPKTTAVSQKLGNSILIVTLLFSPVLWAQEVQLSQRSIGNENHYAISNPVSYTHLTLPTTPYV